MRFELPVFTKCCFCVPMRKGLLAWAWFIIVTQVLMLVLYSYLISDTYSTMPFVPTLCVMVGDIIFGFVLLGAALKMHHRLFVTYFYYGLLSIMAHITVMLTFIIMLLFGDIDYRGPKILVWTAIVNLGGRVVLEILLQVYVVLLVKSLILEGDDSSQYRPPAQQARLAIIT